MNTMTDEEFKEAIRQEVQKALEAPSEKEWTCACGKIILKPQEKPPQALAQI